MSSNTIAISNQIYTECEYFPSYLKEIAVGDTIKIRLRIYNSSLEHEIITLKKIRDVVPIGFDRLEVSTSMGVYIPGENTLYFDSVKLIRYDRLEIIISVKAKEALGKVTYRPILYLKESNVPIYFPIIEFHITHTYKGRLEISFDDLDVALSRIEHIVYTKHLMKIDRAIKSSNLFIHGPPGSGKTVILATLAKKYNGSFVDMSRIKFSESISGIVRFLLNILKSSLSIVGNGELFLNILKEISSLENDIEKKNRILNELENLFSKHRDTTFYIFIDSLDSVPEYKGQLLTIIKWLSRFKNVRIVVSSRNPDEAIPFPSIEINGFSHEEALKYLSEFNPDIDAVKFLKTPILPIYLFYLKMYLKFNNIQRFSHDVAINLPKTVKDWHRSIFNSFDESSKQLLKISALFKDYDKVDLEAVSYVTGKSSLQLVSEFEMLVPYVNKSTYKLFHSYFEEYILEITSEAERTFLAEKIAEYMRNNNRIRDELLFLFHSNSNKSKKRILEIFYPVFEKEFDNGYTETAKKIVYKAKEILESEKNELAIAHIYKLLGKIAHREGNLSEAIEYFKQALSLYKIFNAITEIGETYNLLGITFRRLTELKKSIKYHKMATKIFEKYNLRDKLAASYTYLGRAYSRLNKFNTALKYYKKAYKLSKEVRSLKLFSRSILFAGITLRNYKIDISKLIKFAKQAYNTYLTLGLLDDAGFAAKWVGIGYRSISDFEKSELFFNKSIDLLRKTGNSLELAASINNLGKAYYYQGIFDKSRELHELALAIYMRKNDLLGMRVAYLNLGNLLLIKGKVDLALEYLLKVKSISEQLQDPSLNAYANYYLGRIEILTGKYELGISKIKMALKTFSELQLNLGIFRVYYGTSIIFYAIKDYKATIDFLKKALLFIDSRNVIYKRLKEIISIVSSKSTHDINKLFFMRVALD